MTQAKLILIALNLLFGPAVLASYVVGFRMAQGDATLLWGGVPPGLRPLYTANMFLAAAGYLAMTSFFVFSANAGEAKFLGRWGFAVVPLFYAGVLVCSTIWMPLPISATFSAA